MLDSAAYVLCILPCLDELPNVLKFGPVAGGEAANDCLLPQAATYVGHIDIRVQGRRASHASCHQHDDIATLHAENDRGPRGRVRFHPSTFVTPPVSTILGGCFVAREIIVQGPRRHFRISLRRHFLSMTRWS